jgi:hypothetical protein
VLELAIRSNPTDAHTSRKKRGVIFRGKVGNKRRDWLAFYGHIVPLWYLSRRLERTGLGVGEYSTILSKNELKKVCTRAGSLTVDDDIIDPKIATTNGRVQTGVHDVG